MTKQEKIEYCVGNFNFHKVHRVMEFLEWKWWCGLESTPQIPSVYTVFTKAQDHLENVYDLAVKRQRDATVSSGGLRAQAFYYPEEEGGVYLELHFIVESIWVE